jgi:hypothetical protein
VLSIVAQGTNAKEKKPLRLALDTNPCFLNDGATDQPGQWTMPYALFADLVLVLHAAFILFVVFGGLLVLRRRKLAWLHVPAAVWGIVIELRGWICPLTYLENDLRTAAGDNAYAVGFIEHYLAPLVYPAALTQEIQVGLGLGVLVINAVIYTLVWRKWAAKARRVP